jgi:hypothetical protein
MAIRKETRRPVIGAARDAQRKPGGQSRAVRARQAESGLGGR